MGGGGDTDSERRSLNFHYFTRREGTGLALSAASLGSLDFQNFHSLGCLEGVGCCE